MRAIALMLMLFGTAGTARADWVFTLDAIQVEDAIAKLRVEDTDFQCLPANVPVVSREGNVVRAKYEIEDFTPPDTPPGTCPPYRVTPRFDYLGTFAPGHYEVQVTTCSNPPPPLPECVLRATLPLTVLGLSETTFTVPTLSGAMLIGLGFMVMVLGALGGRRL